MIIKRIYFPGSIYSQNNVGFKGVLTRHGLVWVKSALSTYTSKDNKQIMSGIYYTPDKDPADKILCIYEGNNKPATFFYKTLGTGGNFLIDLNSFCKNIGCIIDDKKEEYMNNIVLMLNDHKNIDILEDIRKEREKDIKKDIEKGNKNDNGKDTKNIKKLSISDIKTRIVARRCIRRYIIDKGDSLGRRGISIEVALFFMKKDLYNDARWALENGFYKSRG